MDKLLVGKIIGTHGIRGELKIRCNSSFIEERFSKGETVFIKKGIQEIEMVVHSFRMHKGNALVAFKDHLNINDVEKYVGYEVYGDYDEDLLDEGEYFYTDLFGVEVYDQNDQYVGKISGIMENVYYDILEIQTDTKKVMVPYVEAYIINEDIENNYMQINVIEGLL